MNYKITFFLCIHIATTYAMSPDLESKLVQCAQDLVKRYEQDSNAPKPIIAIGGGSQVGKTTLSKILLTKLCDNYSLRTNIVPLDNFFAPTLPYTLNADEFNSRVGHKVWQFDHRAVHNVLAKIRKRDVAVEVPGNDFKDGYRNVTSWDFANVDLVICEGIYALTGADMYNLAQYSSLKIFIEAKKEDHMGWYCDMKRRHGVVNPEQDPITKWDFEEDFDKIIVPTKKNADIVLTHHADHSYSFISATRK